MFFQVRLICWTRILSCSVLSKSSEFSIIVWYYSYRWRSSSCTVLGLFFGPAGLIKLVNLAGIAEKFIETWSFLSILLVSKLDSSAGAGWQNNRRIQNRKLLKADGDLMTPGVFVVGCFSELLKNLKKIWGNKASRSKSSAEKITIKINVTSTRLICLCATWWRCLHRQSIARSRSLTGLMKW